MKKNAIFALIAVAAFAVMAFGDTLINGAGATFPFPMYSKWFSEYKKKNPMVQINYQSRGSGAGIQQVTAGTVDFGAADVTMNDMQLKEFADKRGSDILHFPTVIGAVVPAYEIKGVTATINFTGAALAGIYLGKITQWNDPELTKANPGVNLPKADIVVVHRAEASGTSFIWTDYLSKVSPEWKMKVGSASSVNWPVGLGGQGTEGVAGQIKQTPNTIGYIELTYALQNKIPYGKVKNAAGDFVLADLNSVTAAAAGAAKTMPDDFRVSITNAPGKTAYPISSFTWLLIPAKISDPTKKKALTDFLAWMLKDGQTMTEALSFAPLPKEVVAKETKAIAKIK